VLSERKYNPNPDFAVGTTIFQCWMLGSIFTTYGIRLYMYNQQLVSDVRVEARSRPSVSGYEEFGQINQSSAFPAVSTPTSWGV